MVFLWVLQKEVEREQLDLHQHKIKQNFKICNYVCWWMLTGLTVKRFYLFIFRQGKGERNRGRETPKCGCLSWAPHWEPGPQPRHVPWLGIELVTPWFAGWHSIYWATPARAKNRKLLFMAKENVKKKTQTVFLFDSSHDLSHQR